MHKCDMPITLHFFRVLGVLLIEPVPGSQHQLIFVTSVTQFAVLRRILTLPFSSTGRGRVRLPLINSLVCASAEHLTVLVAV